MRALTTTLAQPNGAVVDVFVQYSALGVFCLLAAAAVRVLYAQFTNALELERKRRDALEVELRELNAKMQDKIVPVLTEATRVIGDVLKATQDRDRR